LNILATQPLAAGTEIFFNDAPELVNHELLEIHGIVVENKMEASLRVGVSLNREDKMFGNKKRLLEARKLKK
jgi:hypothetical protein